MAPRPYSRTYHRFPLFYPVIFGGAPFVLCGSDVRVSVLLSNQRPALPIDLGTIKWAQGHQFGVEFLRLPLEARQRLNSTLGYELIELFKARSGRSELPELLNRGS